MKDQNKHENNTVFAICQPIIYIVISVLLLFTSDKVDTTVFAYLLGAILIIGGAATIIRYFITKSYLKYNSYDFSVGVLAAILGIIIMIKAKNIAESFTVCLGIAIMLTAIVKLQNAIQLITIKSKMWVPVFIIAVLFIAASVIVLINPFTYTSAWEKFTYITLLADGIVGLAVSIYLYFAIGRHQQSSPLPPV